MIGTITVSRHLEGIKECTVHKLKNTLKYTQMLGCANLINSAFILSRPGDLFSGS